MAIHKSTVSGHEAGANNGLADILIVTDGKAGHQNQSLGLAEALVRLRPGLFIRQMAPLSNSQALFALLFGRCAVAQDRPALAIGAGHGTHLTLLALKRFWRVPVIVLMRPSLPLCLFDLCLIPEHDSPPKRRNVIATRGALNRIRPGTGKSGAGLILIGGPSKNSGWNEPLLLGQLEEVVRQTPGDWVLTTSRRTPASTVRKLKSLEGIDVVPVEQTTPDWLPEKLAAARCCWVTEDSVSMIYEALSAGCAVGVLEVPWKRKGRLLRGVNTLKDRGLLTPFDRWSGTPLPAPEHRFDEAGRCAEAVLDRGWL